MHAFSAITSLIPQLSGAPRAQSTRNVALVDKPWFSCFAAWVSGASSEEPGPIDNAGLHRSIQAKTDLVDGADFEVVEVNVWEALNRRFTGGPLILRPFMRNPVSGETAVVLYPIKFIVTFDETKTARTADPNWTIGAFVKGVANKLNLNLQAKVRVADGSTVPDEMLAKDYFAAHGNEMQLELTRSIGSFGEIGLGSSLSAPFGKAGSVRDGIAPYSSDQLTSQTASISRQNQTGVISVISSVLHFFSKTPGIVDKVAAIDESSCANPHAVAFVQFMKESKAHPSVCVVSQSLQTVLTRNGAKLSTLKHFEATLILEAVISEIDEWFGEPILAPFFMATQVTKGKCPKCGNVTEERGSAMTYMLDIPARWFRKTKLDDCLGETFGSHRTAECRKCGKTVSMKETFKMNEPPKLLILGLKRFMRGEQGILKNSSEVVYPTELNISKWINGAHGSTEYHLTTVLSHSGQTLHQRYKTFTYDWKEQKWICFNECRARPIEASTALDSVNALAVVYCRADE